MNIQEPSSVTILPSGDQAGGHLFKGVRVRILEGPVNTWESFHAPSSSPSLSHEVTFEQAKLLGKNKVMRGLTPTLYLLSFTQ